MTRNLMHPLQLLVAAPLASLLLSGCQVNTHKNGANNNVNIGTPFGSIKVKTDNTTDTSAVGIAAYPGALPVTDSTDKDGNAANVNMNFGNFHFGFNTASFQTSDSQEKVLAFYRKDLAARYGDVIECRGRKPVGAPVRTSQGLTCDTTKQDQANTRMISGDNIELRAGSLQHQHIVGVQSRDGGTEMGLISLDRPSHLSKHDGKDSE